MTIKEVEDRTGLTRSNIRFYEKEKLIEPSRNDKNGYRDYSEKDVENIIKIAYLRTLEISIEDIRNIISDKVPLAETIKKQTTAIQTQIEGLNKAKIMCERMLESGNISFDELQVEKYVADLDIYWSDHKPVFKLDSVSFLYIWGSLITWAIITLLCLMIGIVSYAKLPSEPRGPLSGGPVRRDAEGGEDRHLLRPHRLLRLLRRPSGHLRPPDHGELRPRPACVLPPVPHLQDRKSVV